MYPEPEALWHEPARTQSLLEYEDKNLDNVDTHDEREGRVTRLLVQEVSLQL